MLEAEVSASNNLEDGAFAEEARQCCFAETPFLWAFSALGSSLSC